MDKDTEQSAEELGRFHGWRLLGVLALVVVGIALASAVVDRLFFSGFIQVF